MTIEYLNSYFGGHSTVLALAIAAFYRYGDRTDSFSKSLQGIDSLKQRLLQEIGVALETQLAPLFDNPTVVPSPVVNAFGISYRERVVSPAESERYRQSIREFTTTNLDALVDYYKLIKNRESWCFWASFAGWSSLFVLLWEIIILGTLAVARVFGLEIPIFYTRICMIPSVFGIACFLFTLPCLMRCHDNIIRQKAKYHVV